MPALVRDVYPDVLGISLDMDVFDYPGHRWQRMAILVLTAICGCAHHRATVPSSQPAANDVPATTEPPPGHSEAMPVGRRVEMPDVSGPDTSAPIQSKANKPAPTASVSLASPIPNTVDVSKAIPMSMAAKDDAQNLAQVRQIVDGSRRFFEEHPKYSCRVTRQETIGHRQMPEEVMLLHFRREPRSVYYQWLDERNKGRECIYVEGRNDGKVVTLGGENDFLLTGRRVRVDPDGILARSRSRYSITESGLDKTTARLERVVSLLEQGDPSRGQVHFEGLEKRSECVQELYHIIHHIPPGADPVFPDGAIRHWYFEPATGRLRMMFALSMEGKQLEYYRFDRLVPNELLSDHDFDPDILWSQTGRRSALRKGTASAAALVTNPTANLSK